MSAEQKLRDRVAAAYKLRLFDAQARKMNIRAITGRAVEARNVLCHNVKLYGGEPWPYSPAEDNSWLFPLK